MSKPRCASPTTPASVIGAQGIGRIDPQALEGMMKAAPYTLRELDVKDDVQARLLATTSPSSPTACTRS